MKYALFLGCFIPVRFPHIEAVARKILPQVGIELVDLNDFTCCPEPVGFLTDKLTSLAIAARNISIAEEEGIDILTLCNGCTYSLKQANKTLRENIRLKEKVNDILVETDHRFSGTVRIKHFAQVIAEEIGISTIKSKVIKPLKGIRIACHTGCHLLSPPEVMEYDDPFDPMVLDNLVKAIGANPVDWDKKTLCCGWTLTNYGNKESANRLLDAKIEAMNQAKADCSAVICPQCFHQFDRGQLSLRRESGKMVPTLFYLQLLALAMGSSLDEINLKMHRVRNEAFEEKLMGILT